MNRARKIELLYRKAKGQSFQLSPEEKKAIRKYKVYERDENYATKANISEYVAAVDKGYCLSFYDWCMNHKKGDRRRKGSSKADIAATNRAQSLGAVFMGWFTWGLAIYWMFDGALSVGQCIIAGSIVSVILLKCAREWAGITLFLLPIILTVIWGA